MANEPVQLEIDQIVQLIPNILWLRFVRDDGFCHSSYRFDANTFLRNPERQEEEDRISAMSAAMLSLGERISYELMLGDGRVVVVAGENAVSVLVLMGVGQKWMLSFAVNGHPPVDPIIQHFKERNYLAHLIPLL